MYDGHREASTGLESPHMSGSTATPPTIGTISTGMWHMMPANNVGASEHANTSLGPPSAASPTHDAVTIPTSVQQEGNETMTDPTKPKSSLINIPSRTSSTQQVAQASTNPVQSTEKPTENNITPRRGSKRSLLTRSRNNSQTSRRSTRAARVGDVKNPAPPIPQKDGTQSEKKPRSGFFAAFLNCCSPSEDDTTKHDEPPVPAKKTKIQPTPARSGRPADQTEATVSEKEPEVKPVVDEKVGDGSAVDEEKNALAGEQTSEEQSRPRMQRQEESHEHGISSMPSATTDQTQAGPHTPNEQIAQPDVNIIAPTPVTAHDQGTSQAEKDVDMTEAPPAVPEVDDTVVDEPVQPAELQPQVPLPPPPPLSQRQEQVGTGAVATLPDAPAQKQTWLLPPIQSQFKGRKCLVLDLDETLVHSSFKILNQADFTIPVEIEGQYHNVYVIKRPGVDAFMKRVGELYEVVVFTASVSKYGDPLLDQLDIHHVVHHRLFRESCYNHQGNYVKVRCSGVLQTWLN